MKTCALLISQNFALVLLRILWFIFITNLDHNVRLLSSSTSFPDHKSLKRTFTNKFILQFKIYLLLVANFSTKRSEKKRERYFLTLKFMASATTKIIILSLHFFLIFSFHFTLSCISIFHHRKQKNNWKVKKKVSGESKSKGNENMINKIQWNYK